jgi:hypothetical protein
MSRNIKDMCGKVPGQLPDQVALHHSSSARRSITFSGWIPFTVPALITFFLRARRRAVNLFAVASSGKFRM